MAQDVFGTSPEVANKRAADRRKAQEDAKKAAVTGLDAQDKAREEVNAKADERASKGRPTPTQRENDLAKLGVLGMDDKEDDGSGPDVREYRTSEAGGGNAPYRTREAQPKPFVPAKKPE